MKRFLTVLMLMISLIATPLMIERADAHDMEKISEHGAENSDFDHNAKDPRCTWHIIAVCMHPPLKPMPPHHSISASALLTSWNESGMDSPQAVYEGAAGNRSDWWVTYSRHNHDTDGASDTLPTLQAGRGIDTRRVVITDPAAAVRFGTCDYRHRVLQAALRPSSAANYRAMLPSLHAF